MDVRNTITNEKHYIHVPLPLLSYLCSLKLSQTHEHVFLLHWGAGQMNGDWKSQMPISSVAKTLCISESSVKRAYRELAAVGLVKRYSQGRSSTDRMRSDVTITEVFIPDAAVADMLNTPNRAPARSAVQAAEAAVEQTSKTARRSPAKAPLYEPIDADDVLSVAFSSSTTLGNDEEALQQASEPLPASTGQSLTDESVAHREMIRGALGCAHEKGGRVDSRFAVRLRNALRDRLDDSVVGKVWNQMLWSISYGSLSFKHPTHAFNVALKLLKQSRWTTPFGMPDGWEWERASVQA